MNQTKVEPVILVEVNRHGNWMFQDEDGNFYEETTSTGSKDDVCHNCGEKIKKHHESYRSSEGNYFCTECITTIQMGDLWTAYHMRKKKVYYG